MTREESITKEECLAFYKELTNLADARFVPYYEMAIEALEQESCVDAISRQAVLDLQYRIDDSAALSTRDVVNVEDIEDLPSVKPQEPTGHWIDIMVGDMPAQACDRCNTFYPLAYTGGGHKYCPNCGANMRGEC